MKSEAISQPIGCARHCFWGLPRTIRLGPKWVREWTVLVLVVSSAPYIVGLLLSPEDGIFTGNLLNPSDTNSYFAAMRIGEQGDWLYRMPYSAQSNQPLPLFSLFILLGHFARLTSLSLPLVYHLSRIAFAGMFVAFSYRFISRQTEDTNERKLAMFILLFTAGYGWAMVILFGIEAPQTLKPDIWIFDAVSFGSILGFPHFVLNMTLMLWMLMAGEDFVRGRGWGNTSRSILAGLGVSLIHPYQFAVVGATLGLGVVTASAKHGHLRWGGFWRLFLILLPGSALALRLAYLSLNVPYSFLKSWLEPGDTYPLWSLFILYGPILVLGFLGTWSALRAYRTKIPLAAFWFLVVFVLLSLPVTFQRRFIEGWHVPVALLAAVGWHRQALPMLSKLLTPRAARRIISFVLLSVIVTPVFLLSVTFSQVVDPRPGNPAYVFSDELGALEYLRRNSGHEDVVLAHYYSSNRIPAFVGVRSFVGHYSLTPFFVERLRQVDDFFRSNTTDEARLGLIEQFGISFIYYGQDERTLGGFSPDQVGYLQLVYSSPTVSLYRVSTVAH